MPFCWFFAVSWLRMRKTIWREHESKIRFRRINHGTEKSETVALGKSDTWYPQVELYQELHTNSYPEHCAYIFSSSTVIPLRSRRQCSARLWSLQFLPFVALSLLLEILSSQKGNFLRHPLIFFLLHVASRTIAEDAIRRGVTSPSSAEDLGWWYEISIFETWYIVLRFSSISCLISERGSCVFRGLTVGLGIVTEGSCLRVGRWSFACFSIDDLSAHS